MSLDTDIMLVNLREFFILAHVGKGEQVNAVIRWVGPEGADCTIL
jgi:hypothetical protein